MIATTQSLLQRPWLRWLGLHELSEAGTLCVVIEAGVEGVGAPLQMPCDQGLPQPHKGVGEEQGAEVLVDKVTSPVCRLRDVLSVSFAWTADMRHHSFAMLIDQGSVSDCHNNFILKVLASPNELLAAEKDLLVS